MKSGYWPAVDAILAEALELAPGARDAFVSRACQGRPEIAAEVHSLLRASSAAGDFLERPPLSVADPSEPPLMPAPERVGPYRIIEPAGHGGMSIVYRARRDDGQFQKQAAVKLLATGWISPDALRRFLAERQILATLDHPNICRLLDGGVTPEGVPYLVMDFVEGVRLLDYAREKHLGERERLELFRKICMAVQYAHQNLVVHRDIKPANVLVNREGEVKLMDFGIAKVLAESGAREETQTALGAMTPDYASPEQIKGQAITTQSDIYSLGVLLYELLTGRRPYALSGKGLEALLDIVNTVEAPAEPGLPVDLLAIVRRAMRKEPGERYAAAAALEDDVNRYLRGIPVHAVPPSRWYSLRKWVDRHRVPVLAGAAAGVLILSASVFALWSARAARQERAIAEERFRDVRQLAYKVMFTYPDALRRVSAATDLQLQMASDSLVYLDTLARAKSSDPALLMELANGYIQVGGLLGAPRSTNLGKRRDALQAFNKARSILDDLVKHNPHKRLARVRQAGVLRRLSQVDAGNAHGLAERSLEIMQDLNREFPRDRVILQELAQAHVRLAELDPPSPHGRLAVETMEAWAAGATDRSNATANVAYTHRLFAQSLLAGGDNRAALAEAQKAQTLDEHARAAPSGQSAYAMETSLDLQLMATCYLRMNRLAEARDFFHRAAEVRWIVFRSNPGDEWVEQRLLALLIEEGWVEELQGNMAAAQATYHEAAKLAPTLTAAQPDEDWNSVLGFVYASEGLMLKRAGRATAACELFRRSAGYFRGIDKFDEDFYERRASQVKKELAACPA